MEERITTLERRSVLERSSSGPWSILFFSASADWTHPSSEQSVSLHWPTETSED